MAATALGVLGADRLATSAAPLVDTVHAAGWAWAEPVVRVGAAAASLGALLALIAGVGRTSLAMARNGDLPRWLAAVASDWWAAERALKIAAPKFRPAALADSAKIEERLEAALRRGKADRIAEEGDPDEWLSEKFEHVARFTIAPALHGGIERWFAPLSDAALAAPALQALLRWLARVADAVHGPQPWYTEVHAFRIDTAEGIGRPTPEGAHRDGVDLVAVFMVDREAIKGGETRVFALDGPQGQRFTLAEPWSVLVMDDTRVIHETTPIQPVDAAQPGHRDTLVVTLRRGGFLSPSP